MEWITNPESWVALATLTILEIVLGVDNIIFISILAARLPEHQQARARNIGLSLAMLTRIGLLLSISAIMGLTEPLFTALGHGFSGHDVVLILGGLFLIYKATSEIHDKLEGQTESEGGASKARAVLASVVFQIILLDIVFSLDSVITAIGMSNQLPIMIAAVVIAVVVMLFAAGALNTFIHRHPTVKMLALSFLLMIGVVLISDGLGQHIEKGYVYFALAFSIFVEMLNLRLRVREVEPVKLHEQMTAEGG
ncbi:MAG: TerC family protein [Chloroflexi bacterium]|nr:TerC family protein [Chloroflexota bacterium]